MAGRPSDFVGPKGLFLLRKDLTPVLGESTAHQFELESNNAIVGSVGLFDRAWIAAQVLGELLPDHPEDRVHSLIRASGRPRVKSGYGPMANYRFLVLTNAVSVTLGDHHPEHALDALEGLTQRFTAEFDIRHLLRRHYLRTLDRLQQWVEHSNPHVRRLVSEGPRPRLPWARHLECFKRDPTDLMALLSPLRADPSRYVRLSVANCVGDILKDNRDLGFQLLESWLAEPHATHELWIARRALARSLRNGDAEAADLVATFEGLH